LVFTRNPSFGVGHDKLVTYQTPQKAGDFEIVPALSVQRPGKYACSRTRSGKNSSPTPVVEARIQEVAEKKKGVKALSLSRMREKKRCQDRMALPEVLTPSYETA